MSDYSNNGTIAQLTDKQKSPIYPYTKERAVFDEHNVCLAEKLKYDTLPTDGSVNAVQSAGVYAALSEKANSSSLSMVAFSGSYTDLSNKPYIPENYINATYSELVSLRNLGRLVPGAFYRITDYVCTTITGNTMSANKVFDIVVQALSTNSLSEDAKAMHNNNDYYFDDANVEAWELKYSLDNNYERFRWADGYLGKGVIYYMKDEFGNIAYYDFKNIMFYDSIAETYVYTFNSYNSGTCRDVTVGLTNRQVTQNYIGLFSEKMSEGFTRFSLPFIYVGNTSQFNNNRFEDGCRNVTFISDNGISSGQTVTNNVIEGGCETIRFGGYTCKGNTIGLESKNLTFLGNTDYNVFGAQCSSFYTTTDFKNNVFGSLNRNLNSQGKTTQNVFGSNNSNITISSASTGNIVGNGNQYLTINGTGSCVGNLNGASGKGIAINANYNVIGSQNKTIELSGTNNTIGCGCNRVSLNASAKYNRIDDLCQDINLVGGTSQHNYFHNGFTGLYAYQDSNNFKVSYNTFYSASSNIYLGQNTTVRNLRVYTASKLYFLSSCPFNSNQTPHLIYKTNGIGNYIVQSYVDGENVTYLTEDYGNTWKIKEQTL